MSAPFTDWLARGRAAWPAIPLPDALLRVPDGAHPDHAADLYLACACAAGIPEAVRAFDQTVLPQVAPAIRKIDGSAAFGEEVQQRVRDRLLVADAGEPPRIAGYGARGPLVTWVRVAAVRIALDLAGKHRREVPTAADDLAGAAGDVDPALDYLKRKYAREFAAAFRRACEQLSDRERAVLRLCFADGLNIEQIGGVYGVHRATVARWIAKAREHLYAGTRDELRAALALSSSEFDSLLRVVRSRIDISISAFFASTPRDE